MTTTNTQVINFDDTGIAFSGKSNSELRQTYCLFKIMNNGRMVKTGQSLTKLAFKMHLPIQGIIRNTVFKHFCGGTSINDCAKTINKLASWDVGAILDYAAEGEESEELFEATHKEIMRTIQFAKNHKNVPFSVFKISGIARFHLLAKLSAQEQLTSEESEEYELVRNRLEAMYKLAYELSVPLMVDAEETWIQPILDELMLDLMRKYNKNKAIVQNTYQMYRWDSLARIKEHHSIAKAEGFKFGLKLVRGAYMEKERTRALSMGYPSPIQENKAATDRDYNEILQYLVENSDSITFILATHNLESTLLLTRLMDERGLAHDHPNIWFSQLYGMSDNITFRLAKSGYKVIKYLPYGEVKTIMPYLFRRAEENSSIKGQASRELLMIKKEIARRKQK